MIDRNHKLPIKRQAELLGLSRGTVYYLPKPVSPEDLALTRRGEALLFRHDASRRSTRNRGQWHDDRPEPVQPGPG